MARTLYELPWTIKTLRSFCVSAHPLQVAALRAQLAEKEAELEGLGEGLGGLERENSNLEAQVWAPGMFSELPAILTATTVGHGRGAAPGCDCARLSEMQAVGAVAAFTSSNHTPETSIRPHRWTR